MPRAADVGVKLGANVNLAVLESASGVAIVMEPPLKVQTGLECGAIGSPLESKSPAFFIHFTECSYRSADSTSTGMFCGGPGTTMPDSSLMKSSKSGTSSPLTSIAPILMTLSLMLIAWVSTTSICPATMTSEFRTTFLASNTRVSLTSSIAWRTSVATVSASMTSTTRSSIWVAPVTVRSPAKTVPVLSAVALGYLQVVVFTVKMSGVVMAVAPAVCTALTEPSLNVC